MTRWILALSILSLSCQAEAAQHRSRAVRAAFQREHPCPVPEVRIRPGTAGGRRGACPGWQIDHVHALCRGGPDTVDNMAWVTVEDHKVKTRLDVRECAALRRR